MLTLYMNSISNFVILFVNSMCMTNTSVSRSNIADDSEKFQYLQSITAGTLRKQATKFNETTVDHTSSFYN